MCVADWVTPLRKQNCNRLNPYSPVGRCHGCTGGDPHEIPGRVSSPQAIVLELERLRKISENIVQDELMQPGLKQHFTRSVTGLR